MDLRQRGSQQTAAAALLAFGMGLGATAATVAMCAARQRKRSEKWRAANERSALELKRLDATILSLEAAVLGRAALPATTAASSPHRHSPSATTWSRKPPGSTDGLVGAEATLAQLEVLLSRGQISPEQVDALLAECRGLGTPDTTSGRWRHFVGECEGPGRIKIASYNVLADMYATGDARRAAKHASADCPVEALAWSRRRHCILHELEHYHAEVVCLQEVERSAFEEDFVPFMSAAGYKGVHVPRTPWEQVVPSPDPSS